MAHTGGDQRDGVGFFRGLTAVTRGVAHAAGLVISVIGRVLALVTRRSKGHHSRSE
jgi:hypothetical protein